MESTYEQLKEENDILKRRHGDMQRISSTQLETIRQLRQSYAPHPSSEDFQEALDKFLTACDKREQKHGKAIYESSHKAVGVIQEELHELIQAGKDGLHNCIADEAMDIAVAGFWEYISATIRGKKQNEANKQV